MKRKFLFESPDSRTPPPSPFSAGGLSPISHMSPMQEAQPAPGFSSPSPTQHGGHLTITPHHNHLLPLGFQTPEHGNAPVIGIAFLGGGNNILQGPGPIIAPNDMLNVMHPHAINHQPVNIQNESPVQQFQFTDRDSETDELELSSSDSESDTNNTEVADITDQDLLDVAMILTTATPIQHTPANHVPNEIATIATVEIDGLTPLRYDEETTNPFSDGETSSDSESDSESLNKAFILDESELGLQGEYSLFTLEELE